MSMIPDVFQTVLALPESARAELACQIILSLDPNPPSMTSSEDAKAFAETIKRRAERVASGQFQAYSIDETMARVRRAMDREAAK